MNDEKVEIENKGENSSFFFANTRKGFANYFEFIRISSTRKVFENHGKHLSNMKGFRSSRKGFSKHFQICESF